MSELCHMPPRNHGHGLQQVIAHPGALPSADAITFVFSGLKRTKDAPRRNCVRRRYLADHLRPLTSRWGQTSARPIATEASGVNGKLRLRKPCRSPAAKLEPLGRILPRPAGRLHDAVHGHLGARR